LFPSGSIRERTQYKTAPTWEIEKITEAEVAESGRSLQNNKAPGPNRALKLALVLWPGTFAELYIVGLRGNISPEMESPEAVATEQTYEAAL